jgi:hypothetical protein
VFDLDGATKLLSRVVKRVVLPVPRAASLAVRGRIAIGVTAWWEPILAGAVGFVAFAAVLGRRLNARPIRSCGANPSRCYAWRPEPRTQNRGEPRAAGCGTRAPRAPDSEATRAPATGGPRIPPVFFAVLVGLEVGIGVAATLYAHRIILGLLVISLVVTLGNQLIRLWIGPR